MVDDGGRAEGLEEAEEKGEERRRKIIGPEVRLKGERDGGRKLSSSGMKEIHDEEGYAK